jgi:hypothetical protein
MLIEEEKSQVEIKSSRFFNISQNSVKKLLLITNLTLCTPKYIILTIVIRISYSHSSKQEIYIRDLELEILELKYL